MKYGMCQVKQYTRFSSAFFGRFTLQTYKHMTKKAFEIIGALKARLVHYREVRYSKRQ